MANKNVMTSASKIAQINQAYYAPVSVVANTSNVITATYCFLSKIDAWADDNNPDMPIDSPAYSKSVYKNMFVAKRINTPDTSPVIQRNNWSANTIYDYYSDLVNITAKNVDGTNQFNFYINNVYNQVFKCLWNNNGGPSTIEPYLQPGVYQTNNIYAGVDGYKWKYMYTIDTGAQINFMDQSWIPIPQSSSSSDTTNPLIATAGFGDIEVINVTNGGSGYVATHPPLVVINGDGTGASGFVNISNGSITEVIVQTAKGAASPGYNYTTANVSIVAVTGDSGSGATVIAPISPVGGHGTDPMPELGCCNIMYTCIFNGSETDIHGFANVPTDIKYTQVGLLVNPVDTNSSPATGTQPIYKTSTDLIVAQGSSKYLSDEIVYQLDKNGATSFSATMLHFDTSTNIISVINMTGAPTDNLPMIGRTSGCARTLLNTSPTTFVPQSGYITYIENRSGISRSPDGIEQFKFVLSY